MAPSALIVILPAPFVCMSDCSPSRGSGTWTFVIPPAKVWHQRGPRVSCAALCRAPRAQAQTIMPQHRFRLLCLVLLCLFAVRSARDARIALCNASRQGAVSESNFALLTERLGPQRIQRIPRLTARERADLSRRKVPLRVGPVLDALLSAAG